MKITKSQLKRIIREEKSRIIAENKIRQTIRRVIIREARRAKPKYRSSMERVRAEWDGPGESATVAELEAIAKGMNPTEQSEYFKDFLLTILPYGGSPAAKVSPDVLKWLVTNVQSQDVNNYIQSYIGAPEGHPEFGGKVLEPKYQEIHDLMGQMYAMSKEDKVTAEDPSTPLDVLQQLASNKSEQYGGVRTAVAEHPNVSPELLEELSSDSEKGPVFAVAKNPKTPVRALKKLASHENAGVRRQIANNQSTPIDILMKLVNDSDKKDSANGFWSVRKIVAANPNTPPAGLDQLAKDRRNKYIRIEVAKNPSTSEDTLKYLLDDGVATVRKKAQMNLRNRA